jgi:hypothetical protein
MCEPEDWGQRDLNNFVVIRGQFKVFLACPLLFV